MNERERWIVYPLIFFLLLLVTRDNILQTQEVRCSQLVCNRLFVETADGRELVRISGSYDRGVISLFGPVENDIDDERWTESPNANRNADPMVQIGVQTGGGFATFYGRPDAPTVRIGHHESLAASGLMAADRSKRPISSDAATYDGIWGATVLWDQPEVESEGEAIEDNEAAKPTDGSSAEPPTANDAAKAVESTSPTN